MKLVEPYLARYPRNPHRESKQIHDPIGKIIELYPWEVFLLDSPLMQRLRFIRQLGVGHFLFPTSGYSRFEHSLGALHTATLMFDSIHSTQYLTQTGPKYNSDDSTSRRDVVRLAALVHDIGHCIFSHVSERFYGRDPEMLRAVNFFSDYYKSKITPSEATSLLILQTEAFRQLLGASDIRRLAFNEDRILDLVSACVAGSKVRAGADRFLAEIVNGFVDCDKLDYLVRDAHMAGVPISLDIHRLLSKLRVVTVRQADKNVFALSIVPSGARALDELLASRIFLYDKFYYHPKVMAAEELVRRALHYLARGIPSFASPAALVEYGDDEFLALTSETITARYDAPASARESIRLGCELLRRIRLRDLPKRAFAFALRYLPEAPEILARFELGGKSTAVTPGLFEFMTLSRLLENQSAREDHAAIIQSHLRQVEVDTEVFLAVQSAQRAAGSIDLPVVLPGGALDPKPNFLFQTSAWTEAYALNKQTSFVFAYEALPQVHLAAERSFMESGGLTFAPNCWIMAKLSQEDIDDARKRLPSDWLPCRLPPNYLTEDSVENRIQRLSNRFASYLNAFHPEFGPGMVEAWLAQFPDADLQDSAISFLEHITYIEPEAISRGFRNLADTFPELRQAAWISLRPRAGRGKSADQLTVDLKAHQVSMYTIASVTPGDVLKAGKVVFFDDSLNSAVQVSCLLASWLGVPDSCVNSSDADPQGALDGDLIAALRGVPVTFVYYSVHPSGEVRLREMCGALGLHLKTVHSVINSSHAQYRVAGLKCSSVASTNRFLQFLADRGEALLRTWASEKGKAWTKEQTREYALGFGGLDLTIVFRHSISASTPVLLWMISHSVAEYWMPLFPRAVEELRRILDPTAEQDAKVLPDYRGH